MSNYMVDLEKSLEKLLRNICEMYREHRIGIKEENLRSNIIGARNRIDSFFDEAFYKINNGYSVEALTKSLADKLEYLELYETEMRRIRQLGEIHSFANYEIKSEFTASFNKFKREVCELFSKTLAEKAKRKDTLQIDRWMTDEKKAELIKKFQMRKRE